MAFKVLDENVETAAGHISIGTMHIAKGLEFRAVAVMACDDEVIPLQERIETVGDDADLQEVYDTERQLLYVACTRARDHLLVTGVEPASEFLDDLTPTIRVLESLAKGMRHTVNETFWARKRKELMALKVVIDTNIVLCTRGRLLRGLEMETILNRFDVSSR